MHERISKSSSWTPTSIQKKSKSLHAKPSTSIQPKPENISSQQQEIPTYSTAAADLLAANIMRSLEPQEPESSETSTGKPQSELGQAAFPSIAAQIPSTPVVQSQEIGIQRQCSECAKEQSTEEGKDIDEISLAASGIQTKLTIGAPPNPYQQAANQMAEVMSKPILYAPMPQVQRFSPEESQIHRRAASAQSISPMMQMSVEQQAQMSALIQRTFRGEGTQASFEPVQAKLTVGEPGDKYEQEADAVARTVVEKINAPTTESSVQRQSSSGGASELNITVMRQSESGVGEGASVTQDVEQGIQQAKGGGQTLDESVREPMEQAFGADFSGVKVHADSNADILNRSINARAFTTGQDIFFKQGKYNPGSRGGQELLAHELTHVVQQTGAGVKVQRQFAPSTTSSSTTPTASETSVNWDAIVQTELEQFLNRFSNIQVQVKWVEYTATQCVQKSEPVSVHPPYFINKDGDRKTKALKNRQQAGKEVKDLLGEIARPQGHKRGGMGMSRTLVGKSAPEDIQAILQQAIDRNLVKPPQGRDRLNAEDLHDWLVKYGIGVDCSGFVSQALNQVMMRIVGKPLAPNQYIEAGSGGLKGGTTQFAKVKSPAELRPGDTMHIPGHIRIVTSVQTTPEGYIQFTTAESSSVDDIGPTANVWRYENPAKFKELKRKKGDEWIPGDAGKTVTFGRYKVLDQATQAATGTTTTPIPQIQKKDSIQGNISKLDREVPIQREEEKSEKKGPGEVLPPTYGGVVPIPVPLEDGQWYSVDREVNPTNPNRSFWKAAVYNTKLNNYWAYRSIAQRHAFYKFADAYLNSVDRAIKSQWFAAAAVVTGDDAVGAAEGINLWYLSDDAENFLKAGNEFLFPYNMNNFSYLMEGKDIPGMEKLIGQALDNALVDFEQTKVQEFIDKYRGDGSLEDITKKINKAFDAFLAPDLVKEVIKESFEDRGIEFDFKKYQHRVILGKQMVDKLYKQRGLKR